MPNGSPLTVPQLLECGFVDAGLWSAEGQTLQTPRNLPGKPGVYAFAIDGTVQYVGLASGSITKRLGFYAKPGASQSTNIRLNAIILATIGANVQVQVLVAHPPDSEWNGLRIRGPEGLEAGLIADYDLPWNKRGSTSLAPALPHLASNELPLPTRDVGTKIVPSGSPAIRRAIVEFVATHVNSTEREIAQGIFGRHAVQQQVNAHCRELLRAGHLERQPTSPITYRLGRS